MKPIPQSTFGAPFDPIPPGERGDCFSAVLGSLLEEPLTTIPRFCESDEDDWTPAVCRWLRPRGLYYLDVRYDAEIMRRAGFYVLSGLSPRGDFYHSVVADRDGIVHDPHPSGAGIRPATEEDPWLAGLLVPFDIKRSIWEPTRS